jgi:hypothetical protein
VLLGGRLARDDFENCVCFRRYVFGDEQCSSARCLPRRLIDFGLDTHIERVRSRSANSWAFPAAVS